MASLGVSQPRRAVAGLTRSPELDRAVPRFMAKIEKRHAGVRSSRHVPYRVPVIAFWGAWAGPNPDDLSCVAGACMLLDTLLGGGMQAIHNHRLPFPRKEHIGFLHGAWDFA